MKLERGYTKEWRSELAFDLGMPDAQFKVWCLLKGLALHAPQPHQHLKAGDIRTSYSELQFYLRRHDGKPIALETIKRALIALESMKYIQRAVHPGRPMVVRIVDWDKMQGPHDSGHEFVREGRELPAYVDDDPFATPQTTPLSTREVSSTQQRDDQRTDERANERARVLEFNRHRRSGTPKKAENAGD